MSLVKLNARSATALDATVLTGNLPSISGASLTGISAETNSPYFDNKLTSNVIGKNNNTWYYLGYSAGFGVTTNVNVGSGWDESAGYYQAPKAGRYYFFIKQGCSGTSTHSGYDIGFSKLQKASAGSTSFSDITNYPSCRNGTRPGNEGHCTGTVQFIINLTVGERIIFGVHVYSGGSQTNWQWANSDTRWGGMYLGA